jgi:hypothetical protein
MVPAMACWIDSGRRQRINHFVRRQALRGKPSCRVGEGSRRTTDNDSDQQQKSENGARGWPVRREHLNLTVTIDKPRLPFLRVMTSPPRIPMDATVEAT